MRQVWDILHYINITQGLEKNIINISVTDADFMTGKHGARKSSIAFSTEHIRFHQTFFIATNGMRSEFDEVRLVR